MFHDGSVIIDQNRGKPPIRYWCCFDITRVLKGSTINIPAQIQTCFLKKCIIESFGMTKNARFLWQFWFSWWTIEFSLWKSRHCRVSVFPENIVKYIPSELRIKAENNQEIFDQNELIIDFVSKTTVTLAEMLKLKNLCFFMEKSWLDEKKRPMQHHVICSHVAWNSLLVPKHFALCCRVPIPPCQTDWNAIPMPLLHSNGRCNNHSVVVLHLEKAPKSVVWKERQKVWFGKSAKNSKQKKEKNKLFFKVHCESSWKPCYLAIFYTICIGSFPLVWRCLDQQKEPLT